MIITGGRFRGRKIKTVKTNDVRPTSSKVRESIFNIIQSSIAGSVMLDLFAGSGIMGLEAASRGAVKVVYSEKNHKVFSLLRDNLRAFDFEYELNFGDSVKTLDKFAKDSFDLIFVDPPYKAGLFQPVLEKIFQNKILKEDGIIVIEHASDDCMDDFIGSIGFTVISSKKYGDTSIRVISY